MGKIKYAGNGFIQKGETLINLIEYKKIEKYNFGHNEDPDGNSAFGIILTPITPSEENVRNGVDGSFFIATYTFDEENDFEEDYAVVNSALKD